MIFRYLKVSRGLVVREKPIINISLHGPNGSRRIFALVDSGADQSVFSLELIESLALPTDAAEAVEVIGVGGHPSRGYLLRGVEHRLGTHRWRGAAIFSDVMDVGSPMILGQAGFFQFFNVTFKRRQLLMDIRRTR